MDGHDHHNMMNMNHSMMDMTTVDPHAGHNMNAGGMDHSKMDHSKMDHSGMDHSGHNMMDNGVGGGQSGHSMMMMYFHFSAESTILFNGWQTSSWGTMLGSCIAVFIIAAMYEGLKVFREFLLRRYATHLIYGSLLQNDKEADSKVATPPSVRSRMLSCGHFIQTVMHILQVIISYFLMLIFMTYNAWLCMAVALGAGTGYFLFSWRRAIVVDINEHCH